MREDIRAKFETKPVMPRLFGLAAALVCLVGCAGPGLTSADRAELTNIYSAHILPKSSPSQLAKAFERHCLTGPQDPALREAGLRDASYVPTGGPNRHGIQVFLVDDRRPLMTVSDRSCAASAMARTGQAEAIRNMISGYQATMMSNPGQLHEEVEQAWTVLVDGDSLIVATQRSRDMQNDQTFTVIGYRGLSTGGSRGGTSDA